MNKNFGLFAVFILMASGIAGGTLGSHSRRVVARSANPQNPDFIETSYREALESVSSNYADDIDYEKANQAAIQGMLWTLDPHSTFFTRSEFDRLRQDQESRFYGIGVTILRHSDGVYVQSAVEGTPAARAGLRYGDRIVEVDGKDAREWSSEQVSKNVRGPLGESVGLKIERAGAPAPLYFTIVRDSVPLPSIRSAFMVRPGTGYIALTGGFTHTTSDELKKAVADLEKEGMRQIALDLRNNPGGLLDESIKVASEFLPSGATVVTVRGREYAEPIVYKNTDDNGLGFPLVVLVNRNTASASEIVAGAIQDQGRGLIVGETTFGKGLVQRLFQLPFGSGLTLTTAKYYTPYGRLIQRDYSNGSLYDYYVRHDENTDSQLSKPASPSMPVQPGGLAKVPAPDPTPVIHPSGPAIKTAAGRIFYGGGGISPDIEVKPLDLSGPLRIHIYEAAFYFTRQLAAGQTNGLENYKVEKPTFDHSVKASDYPIADRVLDAFKSYARHNPYVALSQAQIDSDLDFVKIRLREEIITAAFGSDAGARTLLESDPQLLRGLDALPEAKRLAETVTSGTSLG